MKCIVNDDVVLSQPLDGPLSAHIPAFAQWARAQGYAWASRYRHVLLAACFSRWLGQQAITIRRISDEHSARYLRSRARRVQIHRGDTAALRHFVDFLRHDGVIHSKRVPSRPQSPVEREAHAFETYLRVERMLAEATITYYVTFAREFLADRFGRGHVTFARLCAGDVVRFVQRRASRLHVKRAKQLTTALRAFLHYVRYRGDITHDLMAAVPSVANWSMPSIPRAIPAAAVRQLLASINRQTARGRRDYAILLLLARRGLRASEVAFLELDDLNWEGGQVTVRGKRGARAALPVPADVGAAIAAYLRHGRPRSACRRVFLRAHAPFCGFAGPSAIACVVRDALERAGVNAPTKGAHQFRHGLATQMLRRGASLTEIGEVLRHRSPETTTIYAKVDLDALRTLALPWPGGAR
ncbi:MAG: tyrosine-type recombinase/integrase [Acidobacteria bacterium]|nr:tyrosine-type recombinase/integrase [Acidobacteriota bacterium]